MIWKVWFEGNECQNVLYIIADSFDEAMSIARSLDMRYCCAQVVDDNA